MPDRKVLVLTADSLSPKMAGPAIRAFEIAKALSRVTEVRLASTVFASLAHADFEILDASQGGLHSAVQWADVIVFQGHLMSSHPWLKDSGKIIVTDIYDPMHLEQLEQAKELPFDDRVYTSISTVNVLNEQILHADFMVCASDKQRDFWMGQLAGLGRINPATYDDDTSLRRLLDVVPFGVQDEPPLQKRHGIKGTVPGITHDDKVILWGGGIYNWFDPLTLIRAVGELVRRRPNVRLFFLGVQHPNPHVPKMQMAYRAQELARELGLLDTVVFFNEGWVPYEERADYLLDADVGVSTHYDHLETSYSFRTRILDYLWASLPIVSTDGDTFADLVARHQLGKVVPPEDVGALEEALESLLFDDEAHEAASLQSRKLAQSMTWKDTLAPLVEFCVRGVRAPDLEQRIQLASLSRVVGLEARVKGLEESFSWRVTAPIRKITGTLRRLRG